MNKNWIIIGAAILLLVAFLVWLFIASSQPLPGQKMDDLGRGHVQIGTEVTYNSNPPTSGKHYADWIRAGVYETPRDDRNLVHSLEHGYVIMHYKCNQGNLGNQGEATKSAEASSSGQLDTKQACDERKNQLAKIYDSKGKHKLIVVPRPNLDTNFALTAWHYIDKLNEFDQQRIEKFIDAHLNMGPEKTMEP